MILLIFVLYMTNILTVSFQQGDHISQTNNAKSLTMVVLPFKSVNEETEQNIGIGVAESLSNKLGNIKRLTIISASSGRELAEKDVREIGQQLGVGYILRGNIDSSNNQTKVSAEFVNAFDDQIVWSETLRRSDGNLIDVQTKIAEKIWKTLQIEPSPVELQQLNKIYTEKDIAYELFLLGRYQMINRSPENLKKAISIFSQARDIDPNFALAYVGLADAYALLQSLPNSAAARSLYKIEGKRAESINARRRFSRSARITCLRKILRRTRPRRRRTRISPRDSNKSFILNGTSLVCARFRRDEQSARINFRRQHRADA